MFDVIIRHITESDGRYIGTEKFTLEQIIDLIDLFKTYDVIIGESDPEPFLTCQFIFTDSGDQYLEIIVGKESDI